ncbi:hypothetical protein [Herbidospora yilanensis]|uniref:hypothetical protein n=1 Tax=Herbidospora yilanensis TaxID=354426 RepID=UPI0007826784|nr:hypothetical protein [Herbidospora yilanensis]
MKRIPSLAVLLLAANCQWTSSAAPLLASEIPATSVAEVAERLDAARSADGVARPLDAALGPMCEAADDVRVRQPGHTTLLRLAESPDPLAVRIWLTGPAEARRLSDEIRPCFRSFSLRGWQAMAHTDVVPTSSDNGDPIAQVYVVARRGPFLAEISWWWPAEYEEGVDRGRLDRGLDAVRAVLGAVSGP